MKKIPAFITLLFLPLHVFADTHYISSSRSPSSPDPEWQRGTPYSGWAGETITDDFLVNDDTIGGCNHWETAITREPSGKFVVAWTDLRNGYSSDIYAQRYSPNGVPVGCNFKVNDDTGTISHHTPGVATDCLGNFVIVWWDHRKSGYGIYAQRYDSAGVPLGSNFKVSDILPYPRLGTHPIAMDASGNFIITWESYKTIPYPDFTVYARTYDSTGAALGQSFSVNDDDGLAMQTLAAVATGAGEFVIAWHDRRTGSDCIYAQIYMWPGTPLGSNFQVNDDAGELLTGSVAVAMNSSGDIIMAWEDKRGGIWAQKYDPAGTPVGSNFRLYNDIGMPNGWYSPDVAIEESGNFVVAWEDRRNGQPDIYAQRYDSTCAPLGSNLKVNDDSETVKQTTPAIATDGADNFVITWEDPRNTPSCHKYSHIYAQRYDLLGIPSGSNFKVSDDIGSSSQLNPSITADNCGNFIITWVDYREDDLNLYAQRYDFSGIPLGPEFKVNDDLPCTWQQKPDLATDNSGNFIVTWQYDSGIYARRFDSTNSPLGPQFAVHCFSDIFTHHESPAVAMNGSGNSIVTWRVTWAYPGGPYNRGIYAQRYGPSGVPLGSNFAVSTGGATNEGASPTVSMGPHGNFIIVWHGPDDAYAQRYDSSGTALGPKLRVNDDSGNELATLPDVATDEYGNFVVTWHDWHHGNADIFAQRYDSSGTPLGSNFKVNDDSGATSQMYPAVSMDGSGRFVITWEDHRKGSSPADIYAQRYTSDGNPVGSNYLVVNCNYVSFAQADPAVAIHDSHVYFAWMDNRRAKAWDIYAKVTDWNWTEVEQEQEVNVPNSFELCQNYPNPFNPITNIRFTIGSYQSPAHTTLKIYNILGQLVRILVDEEKAEGNHTVYWDGRNQKGKEVSSGIYFYKLEAGDSSDAKKMVLLR